MAGTGPNTDTLSWGKVQRYIQQGAAKLVDGMASIQRYGGYGETIVELLSAKNWKNNDEGAQYFTTNPTAQTGIAGQTAVTGFVATTPFLIAQNNNPLGQSAPVNAFLDYLKLTTTVAGTSGTNLYYAWLIDQTLRYVSGGSSTGGTTNLLGPSSPNTGAGNKSSVQVFAGNLTASAASQNVRTLGHGLLRSAITVVGDSYTFNFGGHEMAPNGQVKNGTNPTDFAIPHPAIEISPGHSALLYIWAAAQAAACSFELELSHVER